MQLDDQLAEGMAKVMFAEIERACSPLVQRIVSLEAQLKAMPAPRNGVDGKDADPEVIRAAVAEAVAAIPPAKDGADAPPVEPSDIVKAILSLPEIVDEAVQKYLVDNPPAAGKDAEPVADDQIARVVALHLASNPPAPGRDGRDGQPGIKGMDGANGVDGKDGRDGADGLGFDDLTVEHDGEGNVTLKFIRGDQVKEFSIRIPGFVDRGIYRDVGEYLSGNGVTFGGSYWIAQKDAPEGKPGLSEDWRLAVKRGRDGKDGANGKDYTPAVVKVGK
jgi:hypothetical protein